MGPPPKKRQRKRKRRAPQSSSSSSSSSESDPDTSPDRVQEPPSPPKTETHPKDSSSDSSSSVDSETDDNEINVVQPPLTNVKETAPLRPPSPSPPLATIPFVSPSKTLGRDENEEKVLKDRFRKFWMSSVADGFKEDLEEIRKEPNLGPSRLALLIDSLASGADVFTSSSIPGSEINEMQVALDPHS